MANKPLPSQEALRQLLDYDPETGSLAWRHRAVQWFEPSPTRTAEHIQALWNARYANAEALTTLTRDGYRHGHVLEGLHRAHRVIWKWMTGEEPEQVDHINGVRSDNRWLNLRNVTWAENAKNHKRRSDNTSGSTGIYWYRHARKQGKWLAKIGGEHIGYFHCLGQAVRARKEAERRLGFHENHGRAA